MDLFTRGRVRSRRDAQARSPRGETRHWKVPGLSKLRIGGSVGKIGEAVKKVIPSTAALAGSALGGVGELGASALNGTLGDDLSKGAKIASVAVPAIGKMAGGGKTVPTVPTAANNDQNQQYDVNGEPITQDPQASPATPSGGSNDSSWYSNLGGDVGSVIKSVGDFVTQHGGQIGDAAKLALAGLALNEGIKNSQQAGKYRQQAIDMANQQTSAPDLSTVFIDSSNPFTRGRSIPRIPAVGKGATNG